MSQLKIKDGNNWIGIPASGIGVPSGGNAGDVLVKSSSTDYATEWAEQKYPVPDYSQVVELQSVWGSQPTPSTTATYTCPSDGFFYLFADRAAQGQTLYFRVNGVVAGEWPAYISNMNIAYLCPVRQGDQLNLRTDGTSWVVRIARFYPIAG